MLEGTARTVGRLGRWLRYAVRHPDVSFVHDPSYRFGVAGGLMDVARADKILGFLTDEHLIRRHDVARPRPASLENILRVHTPEYLETLSDPEVMSEILGVTLSEREAHQALDVIRLMTGGTIQATRLALRTHKTAVHLAGGFHHARPDRGMGFCAINDVAVAIRRLRARGFDSPVLVVDLDLHDGNGTRAVFAADPTVHTLSIHNQPWEEDDEAVASTSIALGSDVTDRQLMEVLRDVLPPLMQDHDPGLVIYVAGVDGSAGDAIGDWRLSGEGLLQRDRFVTDLVRNGKQKVPLVVVLAGGYGHTAWRHSARYFGWLASGAVIEPPEEAELLLRKFRDISQRWEMSGAEPRGSGDWGLTPEDIMGQVTHQEARFLGTFPRHAMELQMEQLGLLDRMRMRGFRNPTVALDAAEGLGQILRVYADHDQTELLMELKASRSRSIVPQFEVIEVEWLLLQNPRADFTEARPQLPGQKHPGLGLLRDIAVWMVVVAERLSLDGIAFAPSQFYMAAVGRKHLRFVDPEVQALFEVIRDTLAGVDLSDATHAVDRGMLVDEETGERVRWQPAAMVVPVSPKLQEQLDSAEYREAVTRARANLSFELRQPGAAS
jgi:acetoin utilization deacetylase AcuC-like enzyme